MLPQRAHAQSPLTEAPRSQPALAEPTTSAGVIERNRLVLRIDGPLADDQRAALQALLTAEIRANEMTIALERSEQPRLAWIGEKRTDPRALVIAILDARRPNGWNLYVIDAARGRAIARPLSEGVATNAAALEAVATILASAVAAVREGLEVASKPVEAVVPEAPAAGPPHPVRATPRVAPQTRNESPDSAAFRLFAAAAFSLGSFRGDLAPGVAASAGAGAGFGGVLRLEGRWYAPIREVAAWGEFELTRSDLALKVGWTLPMARFELEPELGLDAELTRRSRATALPGSQAEAASSHWRFGPGGGVRIRRILAEFAALELGLGATYHPQRVRFVTGAAQSQPFAELAALAFHAQLGAMVWISP